MVTSAARRRAPRRPVLLLVLLALLAGCTAEPPRQARPVPAGKPNVVVVMTDDQWLDSMRFMPRTQRLFGTQGVTFDRYYASYPLCCPSRSTFLSGQFAHNNGVRHNADPLGGYDHLNEAETLPVWLQRAGYTTSHIGKYPNGYGEDDPTHVPPGWDEWRGSTDPSTYSMYGYRLNENGRLHTYGDYWHEDPRFYQTDVYRDKGVDFIHRQARAGNPFFLSVAFLAPHGEITKGAPDNGDFFRIAPGPRPALRHKGAFADVPLPADPSFDEADLSDKPEFLRDYPRITGAERAGIAQSHRTRAESLLAVDEAVQQLVDALRQEGALQHTYLVFTSDNGFFFGQHRVPTGKFLPHETSAHIPLMVMGPGIARGGHSAELTENPDLTATIADMTGSRPGLALDGRSLLPFAQDPRRRTARPILHEAAEGALPKPVGATRNAPAGDRSAGRDAAAGDLDQDGAASPPPAKPRPKDAHGQVLSAAYEGIRTDRYLYVRYAGGARELYDLAIDPAELRSRHADARYAQVRRFLDEQLTALQGCTGAACNREIPPPPRPS